MKMKSKTKRAIRQLLSTLAVLAILCQIPAGAAALAENTQISTESAPSALNEYAEDISLRTEQEKHFHYGENGYIAAVYTDPVHYLDSNNEWQDIDNTLKLVAPSGNAIAATGSGNGYYENTANSFKVRLPQALSGTSNIQLQYADHALSFRMLNTSAVSTAAIDNTDNTDEKKLELLQQSRNAADTEKKDQLLQQAVTLLPNQAAGLTYANVQQNTHLVYRIDGQKLKESIILTAPTTQQSFSFTFTYTGLTPVVQEFGAVHFYADNQLNGEPIFIIQAPYMEDANTQEDTLCMDIDVTVTPTATGCIYTMTPDTEWLNDPARVYPITIDPTATTSTAATDIQDNGVNQFNPTTNYMTTDRMYVGSNLSNGTAYESRIYIRFPRVSAITTSAYIASATMYLNHYPVTSYQTADNNTLDVYEVGNYNWSSSTITWNSQSSYSFTNRVTSTVTDADNSSESFNVTSLVRKWYSTSSSNNGLVIKPRTKDTSKTNRTCYFSSDCDYSYVGKRPRISIKYYVRNLAYLVGITNTGHDHATCLTESRTYLVDVGYQSTPVITGAPSLSSVTNYLDSDTCSLFVSRSHGGKTTTSAGAQIGTFILLNDDSNNPICLGSAEMSTDLDLSNLQLALFIGCQTGAGGTSGKNLPSVAVARGARTAIGFKESINCSLANSWTKAFLDMLDDGLSVKQICERLAQDSKYSSTTMTSYIICGDTNNYFV